MMSEDKIDRSGVTEFHMKKCKICGDSVPKRGRLRHIQQNHNARIKRKHWHYFE